MRNIDWLCENDRDALIKAIASIDCKDCPAHDCCCKEGYSRFGCMETRRVWLESEHDINSDESPAKMSNIADFDINDSREKLEADIRERCTITRTLVYPDRLNSETVELVSIPFDTVKGWLDRQAAITMHECGAMDIAMRDELQKRTISGLEQRCEQLKSEREFWKSISEFYKAIHNLDMMEHLS